MGFEYGNHVFQTIQFPGEEFGYATGISDNGNVVGTYVLTQGRAIQGFLLTNGNYQTIEFPGSISTTALGANDQGVVVGIYNDVAGQHGFIYRGLNRYESVNVGQSTQVTGIDNEGDLVGTYYDAEGHFHGFFQVEGGGPYIDLDYPGAVDSFLGGVNEGGQLVGSANLAKTLPGAQPLGGLGFLWSGLQFHPVVFPNSQGSLPNGINNRGDVVGTYNLVGGPNNGFFAKLPCSSDVGNQLTITQTPVAFVNGAARSSVTITNNGPDLYPPVALAVDGLPSGVTLQESKGNTSCAAPSGSPYRFLVALQGIFSSGFTLNAPLVFSDPNGASFSYTPRVLAGKAR